MSVTHLCSLREARHCLHKVHALALVLFEDIKDGLGLASLRLQFCCHSESVYLPRVITFFLFPPPPGTYALSHLPGAHRSSGLSLHRRRAEVNSTSPFARFADLRSFEKKRERERKERESSFLGFVVFVCSPDGR